MTLVRGAGGLAGQDILIERTDPGGVAIVSLETPGLRASEYRRVAWLVEGADPGLSASVLWRSDYRPGVVHTARLLPNGDGRFAAWVAQERDWIGKITGLALVIKGVQEKPLRVRAVMVSPHTAGQALQEIVASWLTFAPWDGAAVNTVDSEAPAVPILPVAAAVAVLGGLIYLATAWFMRWRMHFAGLALLLLFSWLLVDAFWMQRLLAQTRVSFATFSGKTLDEKHLAADDAPVYSFAKSALGVLPKQPSRVFIASDEASLRGRLAYYLLPHQAMFQIHSGSLPSPAQLRPGDYVVSLLKRNLRFSPAENRLAWDGNDGVAVEILLLEKGGAVFRIR